MLKKAFYRTAAAILAAVLLLLPVRAVTTNARSCILIDADTGKVLYENQADTKSLIASTTKIMTALVVLEHLPLEQKFSIPVEATGIEGSSMYLKAGESLTVEQLLYGMMLQSGNDAAIALALVCAGSVEEFVVLMNLKAQKLGLSNTHFENPNGLDGDQHFSTARDLALLTQYALQNADFRRIVSSKTMTFGDRCLKNHNRLLWQCDGCIGVKTGYTKAAGRILVSAAERNGRTLIAVTIHDGNDWQDHMNLFDYGFSKYQTKTAFLKGEVVAHIPLLDGNMVALAVAEPFSYALADGEKLSVKLQYPHFSFVQGESGTMAGMGSVCLGEKQIGEIKLLWG